MLFSSEEVTELFLLKKFYSKCVCVSVWTHVCRGMYVAGVAVELRSSGFQDKGFYPLSLLANLNYFLKKFFFFLICLFFIVFFIPFYPIFYLLKSIKHNCLITLPSCGFASALLFFSLFLQSYILGVWYVILRVGGGEAVNIFWGVLPQCSR